MAGGDQGAGGIAPQGGGQGRGGGDEGTWHCLRCGQWGFVRGNSLAKHINSHRYMDHKETQRLQKRTQEREDKNKAHGKKKKSWWPGRRH